MIDSDLGDFKNAMSWDTKRYYIIFEDHHPRFTKVYLLKSKEKVEEMFIKYKAK